MKSYNFFPTNVWIGSLDIDNNKLLKKIYKFAEKTELSVKSNEGIKDIYLEINNFIIKLLS